MSLLPTYNHAVKRLSISGGGGGGAALNVCRYIGSVPASTVYKQEMCHNVTNAHKDKYLEASGLGQGHNDPKTVCDTQQPLDASTHY